MASPHNPTSEQDGNSLEQSTESSATHSRNGSGTPRERHRVRFTPGGESLDDRNVRTAFDVQEGVISARKQKPMPLPRPRINPVQQGDGSSISAPQPTDSSTSLDITTSSASSSIPQAGPSIMRLPSPELGMTDVTNELLTKDGKKLAVESQKSQKRAHKKARKLSLVVGSHSAPASGGKSPARFPPGSPGSSTSSDLPLDFNSIPLENLQRRTKYGIEDDTEDDEENEANDQRPQKKVNIFRAAAERIVRPHESNEPVGLYRVQAPLPGLPSGPPTPIEEQNLDDYVARPKAYREGFLSSILKLYNEQGVGSALAAIPSLPTPALGSNRFGNNEEEGEEASSSREPRAASQNSSGTSTPRRRPKWYYRNARPGSTGSIGSIATLVNSTTMLAQPAIPMAAPDHPAAIRPLPKQRSRRRNALDTLLRRGQEESIHIQVHIAETLSRQIYLLKLCRALMQYGAPTHRLEGRQDLL